MGSSSKLNFHGEIKEKYTFEKYLDFINNRQHKGAVINYDQEGSGSI